MGTNNECRRASAVSKIVVKSLDAAAQDDGVRYPAPVAYAMADGAHPMKAWREHKGLTLQALASAAGVSKPYVSQIEGGKRAGTTATLKKLAAALRVPLGALAP